MKLYALLLASTFALGACAQMQVNHYLPSGDGELRNRSLCTFGLRDELEVPLSGGIKARVWGGDPDTSQLSARVQVLVPEGQKMRFMSNRFSYTSREAPEQNELVFTGITTVCPAEAVGCKTRLGPTDWLLGGKIPAATMLSSSEPQTYRIDLAVPVPPGENYALRLPDVEYTGHIQPGPTVRFEKSTTPAATNLSVCQP
ncbi:MAG: hypothetical protein K0Q76_1170 [Panacagrimonas sp.]|nr:hypothetical protein [Panacagrimonas sp.]MCC2656062.1 hypothetical protein [Panacagrimonas sp.]